MNQLQAFYKFLDTYSAEHPGSIGRTNEMIGFEDPSRVSAQGYFKKLGLEPVILPLQDTDIFNASALYVIGAQGPDASIDRFAKAVEEFMENDPDFNNGGGRGTTHGNLPNLDVLQEYTNHPGPYATDLTTSYRAVKSGVFGIAHSRNRFVCVSALNTS